MTFNVYIYEGTTSSEELSHELAKDAVRNYCTQKGIVFDDRMNRWNETEKGKPYFEALPVHFNVSHSGMLWVCMVGDAPCGIDIQIGLPPVAYHELIDLPPGEPSASIRARVIAARTKGKAVDEKERRRLSDLLLRRGFAWRDVKTALNALGAEICED